MVLKLSISLTNLKIPSNSQTTQAMLQLRMQKVNPFQKHFGVLKTSCNIIKDLAINHTWLFYHNNLNLASIVRRLFQHKSQLKFISPSFYHLLFLIPYQI